MSNLRLAPKTSEQLNAEVSRSEALSFKTNGVSRQAALDYLGTPEGRLYRQRLIEAAPDAPIAEIRRRAIEHITSGRELPRMEIIDEPLVKIVPKGSEPSAFSPFWARESDLDAAVREGKNLSEFFALPINSESPQYDVYRIKPKSPTEVFINTVAPTSELDGLVTKPGGAQQYLVPNRQLFEPHEFSKTVDNRLRIPVNGHDVRASTVLKGLGAAGTAYGLAEGYGEVKDAVDGARSTREQHVRGAEAATDLGTRAVVSGGAAVVGGAVGGAGGTAVAPGAGTAAGAILLGGAAAVGAEHAYEKSRLQQFSRWAGRQAGAISYEYFSDEGKLGRRVESLRQELMQTTDESARSRLKAQLHTANEAFKTEVDRNNAYFQGREGIEKAWPEMSRRHPKLDKDDVVEAYEKRHETQVAGQPSGKPYPQGNEHAVQGAFSDAVHERYPRALPHVPQEDYRTLSPEQLAEKHRQYAGEVVQDRRALQALVANKDSHNNIDKGWPKALAQQRQADRVEKGLNEHWRDRGHLDAIRNAYKERGLQPPELPAELRAPSNTETSAQRSGQGKPAPSIPAAASTRAEAPAAATSAATEPRLGPVSQQLLKDSEREVAKVAQRHGLSWDPGMQNTSAAVAATAREAGLSRVNLLRANGGQIHLAHYDGVQVRDAWVDAKVAANTPQEQSLQRLEDVDRRVDQRAGRQLQSQSRPLEQPVADPIRVAHTERAMPAAMA